MQGCWGTRTTIKVTPWSRLLGTVESGFQSHPGAGCWGLLNQGFSLGSLWCSVLLSTFPELLLASSLLLCFFYCQIKSYKWSIQTGWIHTVYHQSLGVRKALSFRNMEGNVWNWRIRSNTGNGTRQPREWRSTQDHGLRPCFHCTPKSLGYKSSSCLRCLSLEPLICLSLEVLRACDWAPQIFQIVPCPLSPSSGSGSLFLSSKDHVSHSEAEMRL